MSLRYRIVRLWRDVTDRRGTERELDDELRAYLAPLIAEYERDGLPPAEARRRALAQVGSVEAVKDEVRDVRAASTLEALVRDPRLAMRGIARRPVVAATLSLSLALGVGGSTALFSVLEAALLEPLPYANAHQLHEVEVWWGDFSARLSRADLAALREQTGRLISAVGAYWFPSNGFAWRTSDGADVVQGAWVTADLPRTLGVAPVLGPGFGEVSKPEVLVGHRFWRERLGARPDAVGTAMTLNGETFTIVGVMPEGFDLPNQTNGDVWARALEIQPQRRGPFYLHTIVRHSRCSTQGRPRSSRVPSRRVSMARWWRSPSDSVSRPHWQRGCFRRHACRVPYCLTRYDVRPLDAGALASAVAVLIAAALAASIAPAWRSAAIDPNTVLRQE